MGVIREAFTALGFILIAALLSAINWAVADGVLADYLPIKPIFHVFNG